MVGLINQSFYHEILLLQKFNDIRGKVLKPKKIGLQLQKKMRPLFGEQTSRILEPSLAGLGQKSSVMCMLLCQNGP